MEWRAFMCTGLNSWSALLFPCPPLSEVVTFCSLHCAGEGIKIQQGDWVDPVSHLVRGSERTQSRKKCTEPYVSLNVWPQSLCSVLISLTLLVAFPPGLQHLYNINKMQNCLIWWNVLCLHNYLAKEQFGVPLLALSPAFFPHTSCLEYSCQKILRLLCAVWHG